MNLPSAKEYMSVLTGSKSPNGRVNSIHKLWIFTVLGLLLCHLEDSIGSTCYTRCVVDNACWVIVLDRSFRSLGVTDYSFLCKKNRVKVSEKAHYG